MQLKEFDIILDIKKSYKTERFEVVQGDSYSNVLNITLVDGLHSYDLTGTTVEIVFSKSDGTTVQQTDITIINESRGRIQCILKTNTIASPGKVIAEVRVLDGDVLLTSTRFEFYVRRSLINDETIESTNEFPLLTQLIAETNDLIERVGDIEAQVPEEVVNNLNALADYVNDLAGEGRTTETVKGVSDALKTHEAEGVTQAHGLEYEEGTFTPILRFGGSSDGIVYNQNSGLYTRIGDVVSIQISIALASKGTAKGTMSLGGLPFPRKEATSFVIGDMYYYNPPSNIIVPVCRLAAGGGNTFISYAVDGGGVATFDDTHMNNNTVIKINGIYKI